MDGSKDQKAIIEDLLNTLVHRNRVPGFPSLRGGLGIDSFYQNCYNTISRSDFDDAIEVMVEEYHVEWTRGKTAIKISDRKKAKEEIRDLREELWD